MTNFLGRDGAVGIVLSDIDRRDFEHGQKRLRRRTEEQQNRQNLKHRTAQYRRHLGFQSEQVLRRVREPLLR